MASVLHAQLPAFVFSLSLLLSSALGASSRVVCEQLTAELCAFAVSSTSRRCVLENTHCAGRATEYQCRTSEVVVEDGRLSGLVETDGCVRACGVDRATVGISSDSLLDPRVAGAVCSPACLRGCPNIVDLYSNLAAGEGVAFSELCEVHRSNPRRALAQLQSSGEAHDTTTYMIFSRASMICKLRPTPPLLQSMELEDQQEASHRVVHSKNQGCSQSSAVRDEQGDRGNRSANVCCRPRSVANAAKLLTTKEREDVKRAGFGAFLDLKLETPCKPKEAQNLMSVSELKEDHIAMRVHPDVTLNFRPDILEKLMKLPHAPPSRESSQEKMKYLNTKY